MARCGGRALLLAATAHLAHLASHRPSLRGLVLRSGLVTAFVLWAAVQLAPNSSRRRALERRSDRAFIADLAFVLMPWRLAEPWGLSRLRARSGPRVPTSSERYTGILCAGKSLWKRQRYAPNRTAFKPSGAPGARPHLTLR
jgi:hypothetical protein